MNSLKQLIFAVLSITLASSAFANSLGLSFNIKNDSVHRILVEKPVFRNLGWDREDPSHPKLDYQRPNDWWVWGDGPDAIKRSVIVGVGETRVGNNQEYRATPSMSYRTQAQFQYVREDNSPGSCTVEFSFHVYQNLNGYRYGQPPFRMAESINPYYVTGSCRISAGDFIYTSMQSNYSSYTTLSGVTIHLE